MSSSSSVSAIWPPLRQPSRSQAIGSDLALLITAKHTKLSEIYPQCVPNQDDKDRIILENIKKKEFMRSQAFPEEKLDVFFERVLPPILVSPPSESPCSNSASYLDQSPLSDPYLLSVEKVIERLKGSGTLVFNKGIAKYVWSVFNNNKTGSIYTFDKRNKIAIHPLQIIFDAILDVIDKARCTSKPNLHLISTDFAVPVSIDESIERSRKEVVFKMQQILSNDPCRRFTFGINFEGDECRIWNLSRSMIISSTGFNYKTDYPTLIRVILSLTFATDEELGWDHSIQVIMKDDKRRYYFDVGGEVFYTTNEDLIYGEKELIPFGSGTRVYRVYRKKDRRPFVLKDFWPEKDTDTEDKILEKIVDAIKDEREKEYFQQHTMSIAAAGYVFTSKQEIDSVANNLMEGDNLPDWGKTKSFRSYLGGETRKEWKKTFSIRYHYRIVYKEFAQRLDRTNSTEDIRTVVRDTLKALTIMHRRGWVHRDISPNNLYLYYDSTNNKDKPRGIIGDFEEAKRMGVENHSRLIRGTPGFIPREIAKQRYEYEPSIRRQQILDEKEGDKNDNDGDGEEKEKYGEEKEKYGEEKEKEGEDEYEDEDKGGAGLSNLECWWHNTARSRRLMEALFSPDEGTSDSEKTGGSKEKNFYHNWIHDLESFWWIICWIIFSKELKPKKIDQKSPAEASRAAKQLSAYKELFEFKDDPMDSSQRDDFFYSSEDFYNLLREVPEKKPFQFTNKYILAKIRDTPLEAYTRTQLKLNEKPHSDVYDVPMKLESYINSFMSVSESVELLPIFNKNTSGVTLKKYEDSLSCNRDQEGDETVRSIRNRISVQGENKIQNAERDRQENSDTPKPLNKGKGTRGVKRTRNDDAEKEHVESEPESASAPPSKRRKTTATNNPPIKKQVKKSIPKGRPEKRETPKPLNKGKGTRGVKRTRSDDVESEDPESGPELESESASVLPKKQKTVATKKPANKKQDEKKKATQKQEPAPSSSRLRTRSQGKSAVVAKTKLETRARPGTRKTTK